jgi:hypothetical protein
MKLATKGLILLVALTPTMASARKDTVPELETRLGKGWQCPAMPSGFNRVGTVIEEQSDGQRFIIGDVLKTADGSNVLTSQIAIGNLAESHHFSLGAALNLLSSFFGITANYSRNKSVKIIINDSDQQVGTPEFVARAQAWALANKNNFPNSKLYIVREAIVAARINYAFDSKTATDIKAELGVNTATPSVTATKGGSQTPAVSVSVGGSGATNPDASGSGATKSDGTKAGSPAQTPSSESSTVSTTNKGTSDPAFGLSQTFTPKIGVCVHPYMVGYTHGLAGDKVVLTPSTSPENWLNVGISPNMH